MRKGSWFLLTVALLVIPGSAMYAECLETETLASGSHSGFDTAPGCEGTCPGLDLVIEDTQTWAKVWARNWSNFTPPPELPAVNFREQIVIATFMGQRPTTGYGIGVDCISETGLAAIGSLPLTVTITDTSPGVNCIVQPAVTQPFQFVVFDRPTGIFGPDRVSVTFVHEESVTSCGGGDPICRICPSGGIGGIGGIGQSLDLVDDSVPCCP